MIKQKIDRKYIALKREVEIIKKLDHPNIVRCYEIFEDEKYIHIVMELCEGDDMFTHLVKHGTFTEREAVVLFEQMLRAT